MTVELRTAHPLHREAPLGLTSRKLGVVIPALNEEETVGAVVQAVPRHILGCSEVEIIVVDDGSTDATNERAFAAGADRVVTHSRNRGLVASFNHGIGLALARRCDVVVHLDADGQHDPALIPNLVAPILSGDADIVVGVRRLADKGPERPCAATATGWRRGSSVEPSRCRCRTSRRAFARSRASRS